MNDLGTGRKAGAAGVGVSGLSGFLHSAAGVTLAVAFGAPATAQEGPQSSSDVVTITGAKEGEQSSPKATAPLIDTPQTISVIPLDIIQQQGARDLTEVLRNTPGITFNAGENGFGSSPQNFSMRGFDTSGSVFADGARDSGSFNRDSFNVQQVEVVKGPSSDNGRGGAGGYVNIVTKTPQEQSSVAAEVSYGVDEYDSDARVRATLDINERLAPAVAARLNVLWEDGGVAGRAIAQRSSFGVAPSVTIGVGSPTRLTLATQYVQQDDVPDWGVPAAMIEYMLRFDPALDGEALRDNFYGLAADYDEVTSYVTLGRLEHAFSEDVDFSLQLRWSKVDRDASFTVPTGYTPATGLVATAVLGYARENDAMSATANIAARLNLFGLNHRISTGVDVSQEDAFAQAFPQLNNPGGAQQPIASPNPFRAGRSTIAATQESDVGVNTAGVYLYDTVELSPNWEVTGGLRLETYDVDIASRTVAGAPLGPDGLTISETMLSGRLGVVYKPIPDASLYASVGVAPQPPGSFLSTTDISREGDNAFPGYSAGINSANAKVQRSVNYEIGGKWDVLDRRLSATAALFRTERQNVAITGIAPGVSPPPPVALLGYGEQVVQGLELGLAGEVTDDFSIFAGLLFMDSERKHSEFLDEGRRLANPGDYGAVLRTSGDQLAFTPELSGNLWATYTLPFNVTVGGGLRYVGESFVGRPDDAERIIPNGNAGILPSYLVADAMVEYELTDNALLRLNINNLTDEFYAISTNWPAQRVALGTARSYTLSLRWTN